jgi:hypothetical protein
MNELRPDARSLIDTMLEADGPTNADRARVRSKIDARLGLAGAAGAVAASVIDKASAAAGTAAGTVAAGSVAGGAVAGSAVAGSAVAGSAVAGGATSGVVLMSTALTAGKIALAVAVVGASVAAGVGVYRANVSVPAQPQAAAVKVKARAVTLEPPTPLPAAPPTPLPAPAPALASAAPARSREPLAADVAAEPPPAGSAAEGAAPETRAAVRAALPHPAREREVAARALPQMDSVREEAALLASARAAISRGEARVALERLDQHAVRFPSGVLLEERRAVRVLALCASGKTSEARAAAAAFVADSPRSPLVSSVRGACSSDADDFITKTRGGGHP